MFNRYITEV